MKMLKTLMNLIFPPKCIFCRCFLSVTCEIEICKECFTKIPFMGMSDTELMYGSYYDKLISLCEYSGIIRDSLVRFKFRNKPSFGMTLGRLLADKVRELADPGEFDLATCIPLHRERLGERGYNQSELICREVSRRIDVPADFRVIRRIRNTEPQSLLAGNRRYSNVKDAFFTEENESVSGKSVLLIDDIMTTGNTLNEGARVLKEAGAVSVTAAVIASGRKYWHSR